MSERSLVSEVDSNIRQESESVNDEVTAFLRSMLPASEEKSSNVAADALVPWFCDVLVSRHSVRGYATDLSEFGKHMASIGLTAFDVRADHVKIYKAALLKVGIRPATIARKLSVIRGAYRQFAEKGLVAWETVQAICAVKSPPVQKNATPALTQKQANDLLDAIPTDTMAGKRDLALMQTYFITGCRASALTRARVGDLEFDGVEHYLHVVEKRNKESRKILLDAARPLFAYVNAAGIRDDKEGPLFRPLSPDGQRFERRHLSRTTPWRLVKKYCRLVGIDPSRLQGRGIGVHSLRKTAITDAIRNGANMHEVREFAGHSDIRTTELYYVRREEDAEQAARRIQIWRKSRAV